jgi:hypothetical protein
MDLLRDVLRISHVFLGFTGLVAFWHRPEASSTGEGPWWRRSWC